MPKRGSLKSAGKRQESATFLQRSYSNVAVQFFRLLQRSFGQNDIRIAEKRMLQCNFCSATFRKLQRNFHFRLWHVAGWGLEGWGLGLAEPRFLLRRKGVKTVLAEFPAMPSSAVKIASERRCAILVHSDLQPQTSFAAKKWLEVNFRGGKSAIFPQTAPFPQTP